MEVVDSKFGWNCGSERRLKSADENAVRIAACNLRLSFGGIASIIVVPIVAISRFTMLRYEVVRRKVWTIESIK